jgi:GNAT superfamily N-acetyltransferase
LEIEIRETKPDDLKALLVLMRDFAEHQNLSEFLEVTEESLFQSMFGKDSFVQGLMAYNEQTPVAYAIFYQSFSSFRGQRSIYLEDIYIAKDFRKGGIGINLLKQIAQVGKNLGAVRMDFQVLESNHPAIAFYKKHGAQTDPQERHFKFIDQDFKNLCDK